MPILVCNLCGKELNPVTHRKRGKHYIPKYCSHECANAAFKVKEQAWEIRVRKHREYVNQALRKENPIT